VKPVGLGGFGAEAMERGAYRSHLIRLQGARAGTGDEGQDMIGHRGHRL
jgi:hypothetical protein